jgi:hypothetical protein
LLAGSALDLKFTTSTPSALLAAQLSAEEYFTSSGALPVAAYWIGASRGTKTQPFQWFDNSTISNVPSDDPYVHWNWLFPNRRILDYHCALAR